MAGTTQLINVDNTGALISPDGAILGNGNWLLQGSGTFLAADQYGTTTNAISSDGTKVFFESPPTFPGGSGSAEGVGPAHLYMRNLSAKTTTPLDDPTNNSATGAQYEGAAENGSRVYFTSDEGLSGSNTNKELYEFNTNTMTLIPVTAGDAGTDSVVGVTAISNDGTHVYFVATGVLASNSGAQGQTATEGKPNFYVFNAVLDQTTFIATLDSADVSSPQAVGGVALAAEPDLSRPAIPTPDGNVLAFDSSTNLTQQNPAGPATTLAQDASSGDTTIVVTDPTGLVAGRTIELSSAVGSDTEAITSISGSTVHIKPALVFSYSAGQAVTQTAPFEIYRYTTAGNSITCVSCPRAGVTPTGNANFGAAGGGSYRPAQTGVPMSTDGSKIFFDTPDPLAAGDTNTGVFSNGLFGATAQSQDVYEWENGNVSLISDGRSATGAVLGGTTDSGNDVFLTTTAQLVSQDTDGFDDIYDARVGGGFPPPPPGSGSCQSADSCHSGVTPTVFFSVPGSSTLIAPPTITPKFTVKAISAKQRKAFAKTGKVTLTVRVDAGGTVTAGAFRKRNSALLRMSTASKTLSSPNGGTAKLTLKLNAAGRKALAKQHKLAVRIEVSFSESPVLNIASMTLTKPKPKKPAKHKRRATHAGRSHAVIHNTSGRGA